MVRRSFVLRLLAAAAGAIAVGPVPASAPRRRSLLLQESPVAGFQYHEGERLWAQLAPGAPLQLTREPTNPHDARAVAVCFLGRRIGYVPQLENAAVAQLLDRGERLSAQVSALAMDKDPWKRVRFQVVVEM
jgi:hypothetical protein